MEHELQEPDAARSTVVGLEGSGKPTIVAASAAIGGARRTA